MKKRNTFGVATSACVRAVRLCVRVQRALAKWFRIFRCCIRLCRVLLLNFRRFSASFDEQVAIRQRETERRRTKYAFGHPEWVSIQIHVSHVRFDFSLFFASLCLTFSSSSRRSPSSSLRCSSTFSKKKKLLLTTLEWDAIKRNELKKKVLCGKCVFTRPIAADDMGMYGVAWCRENGSDEVFYERNEHTERVITSLRWNSLAHDRRPRPAAIIMIKWNEI